MEAFHEACIKKPGEDADGDEDEDEDQKENENDYFHEPRGR